MSEIKQGYKQTKVGIIPQDWEVVKLGDLSQNGIMNGVFNDPKKVGKGLKLINVVNLYNEPFINYDDLKLLEVSEKEYKKFSALKGDLFFTRSSLKEEGIAHCNLFNIDTNDTVFECHTMRIRPNKEIVNSYYLFRYCQSFYARKILISNSKTTTMTTIDQNGLFSLLVPLPPLKEQEKIAEILMTWDDAITKQTELLEAKEKQKKALMQKLLSGEVRFSGFGDEWEEVRIKDISFKKSSNISANDLENNNGKYKIYGASGILKYIDFFKEDEEYISIVKDGAGVGRILMCEKNSSVLGTLDIIKSNNNISLYFVYLLLKSVNFEKYTTGSTIPHIYFKDYSKEKIKLPSLPEQQKIAEVLSLADDEINFFKNELEELKLQKKALMQKLLTGQVRV